MTRFKRLAVLAVTVCCGLAVATSAANAEQTDLCKKKESPCKVNDRWEQGTNFEAKTEPLKFLMGFFWGTVECTSSTLKGPLGAGGAPQPVVPESLVFVGCKRGGETCTVEALELGNLDLLRTNFNAGEGTLLETEIKVTCGSVVVCRYATESTPFQLLGATESEPAKLTVSEVVLSRLGGICATTTTLDAVYTIITPHPVYVVE